MRGRKSKLLALALTATLVLPACAAFPNASAKATGEAKTVDLDGTYHAALGVSTATDIWINRNAYYDKEQNTYFGTEQANMLMSKDSETNEAVEHEGTFTDVEIKGNGTYTVSLDGANFEGETCVCMMHVATDIPVNDTIKFTDVKVTVNDKTITTFDEAWLEDETDYLNGGMDFIIINHWRELLVKELQENHGLSEDGNGYNLLTGAGNESVKVTFTVSGFNYDNPDAVEKTEAPSKAPASDDTSSDSDSSISTPVIVGCIVGVIAVIGVVIIVVKKKKK